MALNAMVDSFLPQLEKCGTERVKLWHFDYHSKHYYSDTDLRIEMLAFNEERHSIS